MTLAFLELKVHILKNYTQRKVFAKIIALHLFEIFIAHLVFIIQRIMSFCILFSHCSYIELLCNCLTRIKHKLQTQTHPFQLSFFLCVCESYSTMCSNVKSKFDISLRQNKRNRMHHSKRKRNKENNEEEKHRSHQKILSKILQV